MSLTEAQHEAGVEILAKFAEAIEMAGPQGVPSGLLYAAICDKISLHGYNNVIALLKLTRLVEEKHNVLYYLKPTVVYLITLDSHEYFGPFDGYDHAHKWAKATGRTSYQLDTKPPSLLCKLQAPKEF